MDTPKNLTLPTIHLNGTSATSLFEGNARAMGAIRKAIKTLEDNAPHSRDYYVQNNPEQAFLKASTEHMERIKKLQDVLTEMYALAEHVSDKA